MAKKWIQKMHMKKGALHKQLGVPAGKKIPASKLSAAAKKGGTLGRRARLAQTLKGLHGGNTPISSSSMKGQSFGNRSALLKEKAAWSGR